MIVICNGEKYQGKVKTHNEHLHHVKFRNIKKAGHTCAHHCLKRQNKDKEIYGDRYTHTCFSYRYLILHVGNIVMK